MVIAVGDLTPGNRDFTPICLPTIEGTPEYGPVQVGQTLTADISRIADADGLTNPMCDYQWISSDGSTDTDNDATAAGTYETRAEDVGKTIEVRVTLMMTGKTGRG